MTEGSAFVSVCFCLVQHCGDLVLTLDISLFSDSDLLQLPWNPVTIIASTS